MNKIDSNIIEKVYNQFNDLIFQKTLIKMTKTMRNGKKITIQSQSNLYINYNYNSNGIWKTKNIIEEEISNFGFCITNKVYTQNS